MDEPLQKMVNGIEEEDEILETTCEACDTKKPIYFVVTGKDNVPKFKFCSTRCIRNRMQVMCNSDWKKLTNPKGSTTEVTKSGNDKKNKQKKQKK